MPKARKTSDGLEMYYEVSGSGSPIVVVPGGLMTIDQIGLFVGALAKSRQVIAIEPQAHGRTADIDRPMAYESMADDVAALIEELGIAPTDVCGFSVGAGVALQTAIRHPQLVRKLVFLSGTFKGDGEYAELLAFVSTFVPDHPMLEGNRRAYVHAAQSAAGWPSLIAKTKGLLRQPYDWSAQVSALTAPTLIAVGDCDTQPVAHAREMYALLGGETSAIAMGGNPRAQLAVLPGTNHFAFMQRVDLLEPIVSAFLT